MVVQWRVSSCMAACFVLLFKRGEAAESNQNVLCDVDEWLGNTPEWGMHVICLNGDSAEVIPDGRRDQKFTLTGITNGTSLLKGLYQKVKRISKIDFPDKKLSYRNQLPAMYTADGKRNKGPLLKDGVHLIFDGGLWRWPPIKVGYRRELESSTLITIAVKPAVFQVVVNEQWFKTLSEYVLPAAQPLFKTSLAGGLDGASNTNEKIRSSETAWLPYKTSPELQQQESLTQALLRVPLNRFEPHMQVVKYKEGTYYDSHRDYWDPREFPKNPWLDQDGRWHNRFATVLWYLQSPSEGGETWFPRAKGENIPYGEWRACDDRGRKVEARNGTAVLFYSLLATGELDEYSWHCGCPVKGTEAKIAANSWIWSGLQRARFSGPGKTDL